MRPRITPPLTPETVRMGRRLALIASFRADGLQPTFRDMAAAAEEAAEEAATAIGEAALPCVGGGGPPVVVAVVVVVVVVVRPSLGDQTTVCCPGLQRKQTTMRQTDEITLMKIEQLFM